MTFLLTALQLHNPPPDCLDLTRQTQTDRRVNRMRREEMRCSLISQKRVRATYLPTSIFLLILSVSSLISSGETRELTEDYVRKAGIVPAKTALELLMSSLSNEKQMSKGFKHNFREGRYNSQLKTNYQPNFERTFDEMCAVSSSLLCGKKVLKDFIGEDSSSVHDRCTARQEFLECLTENRERCRESAKKNDLPVLPSDSVIKDTQSRISQALWTSGGCLLS